MPPKFTEAQRAAAFWSRVNVTDDPNGCWEWKSFQTHNGYGCWSRTTAHRYAFFLSGAYLAEGMDVCHTCDNRLCCNPMHLFPGTRKENVADSVAKGRFIRGEKMGRSKLKTAEVLAMRQAWLEGTHWKELGRRYGVDPSHARKVVLGKTWKHLL